MTAAMGSLKSIYSNFPFFFGLMIDTLSLKGAFMVFGCLVLYFQSNFVLV